MIEAAETPACPKVHKLEDWEIKMCKKNIAYLDEFPLYIVLERACWLENVTTRNQAALMYQRVGWELRQLEGCNFPNYNTELSVGVLDAAVEWSDARGRFVLKRNVNVEKMRQDCSM